MNIAGYASGYQRERAIDSYKDSLNIRAKLNEIYENANVETAKNKKYNITPIAQTKTAEEEIRDLTLQTEKAMANLKKMLKIDDAGVVLDKLRAGNELTTFNRFFNLFEKDVGNQSNLTPTAYYQLWERYKEKLLASGTTGIFIPSQKADIDALVGRIDTLITSSGLTDAEVKKVSDMVEFLYESGMNKQIEAIYKMLNTKKEYERLVRETKLEREDIAREKKKWKADVNGVLSGLIEAENEAKASRDSNRFAILNEYEDLVKSIDKNTEELQKIDELFADLDYAWEESRVSNKVYEEEYRKLEKRRERLIKETENVKKIGFVGSKKYTTKEDITKAWAQGNIDDDEYKTLMDSLGKKQKSSSKKLVEDVLFERITEPKPTTAEKRLAKKERAKETRLRREEEQKEESIYTSKKEKERLRRKQEQELSEEALLEKFYEESKAKARAEQAKFEKEQSNKAKKLAKTMKGLKAQSYADIEKARLSRTAQNKFKNVIDEINRIIQMGGANLLNYQEAENILQNSPRTSRRSSTEFSQDLENILDEELGNFEEFDMADPKVKKQAEEALNDRTSDEVALQMEQELAAVASSAQLAISETKDDAEKQKIETDANLESDKIISFYTALMQQVEEAGKQKILTMSSKSERVFRGALKAGEVEALEKELNALDVAELEKRARSVLSQTNSYENPTYNLKAGQQTFNAKSGKKHKLIAYIIYHLTGQIIKKQKGGRVYKGRGVESAKDKYYKFGNYLIHVPQLEKGFLALKYPSEGPVKEFPKAVISSDFSTLLYEIIDTKKFNTKEYDKLDDNEKELFDRLITFAKISRNDIENMTKHKKITDKQRDIDIKRFNILKGEIVAGNDNPNVIKEMKALLIKLHSEKVISKADFNKIMQNLVYLS